MTHQNRKTLDLKLRFSDIVFVAVLIVALALGPQMLSLDSDLGRHLTIGNYMLDNRIIPTLDLFSHTRAGLSRPPYEWLSQVLFAMVNRLLGLDGVILLTSIVIALIFALVYQFANRRSGSPILALLIVFLAAGASSIHWLPRPHIFTFLLLGIWIEMLEHLTRSNDSAKRPGGVNRYPTKATEVATTKTFIFPLIMLLWANLHGGFVFGILAWIAYFAGWLWDTWHKKSIAQVGKNLLIVGSTSLIATIITPDLWHNWDAVLNNRSAFILNRTVETMRPNLIDPAVLPYTLLLLLTASLVILNWKTVKAQHIFLVSGLGFMSLLMARNIPLFAIACTPILAELSARMISSFNTWTQVEKRFAGFNSEGRSIWPIMVTLFAIAYFAYFNFNNNHSLYQFDLNIFPVDAVSFLEKNPQSGNMFNDFNWGGYLEYKLWPHYNVFLDSQSDFYGEPLIRQYDQMMAAKDDWKNLLDQHKVDWAIIPPNSPLALALQSELDWKIVYQDRTAIILHKP